MERKGLAPCISPTLTIWVTVFDTKFVRMIALKVIPNLWPAFKTQLWTSVIHFKICYFSVSEAGAWLDRRQLLRD